MAEISAVVPVFNAERTLEACVESLLAQTFADFELILVDDGSADGSPALCEALSRRDPRVRVIRQENHGAAAARAAGLLAAAGRYVTFPDSDDFVDPDFFAGMLLPLREAGADLIAVGFTREAEGSPPGPEGNALPSGVYDLSDPASRPAQDFYRRALYAGPFYRPGIVPSLWSKLIRRELLLALPPPAADLRMGDDAAVTYPALARAKRVLVLNECRGYHYRMSGSSLSNRWDPDYFDRVEILLRGLRSELASCPPMAESLEVYALFLLHLGADLYLFHRRGAPRAEKVETLRRARAQLSVPGATAELWPSGVSPADRRSLRAFLAGDWDRLIALSGARRLREKCREVFAKMLGPAG